MVHVFPKVEFEVRISIVQEHVFSICSIYSFYKTIPGPISHAWIPIGQQVFSLPHICEYICIWRAPAARNVPREAILLWDHVAARVFADGVLIPEIEFPHVLVR